MLNNIACNKIDLQLFYSSRRVDEVRSLNNNIIKRIELIHLNKKMFSNLFSIFQNDDYTEEILESGHIIFYIQDQEHKVSISEVSPDTTLNDYLRKNMFLTGTKNMCYEGGCGSCIVCVATKHPVTNEDIKFAVNSCLVSIFSCHGWKVETVEGIGGNQSDYHLIQKTLAKFNGTQCGYCSGGMVMNMYALLETNPGLTMKEVENSFGGNICRCTGYRPILAAFKSLCKDADPELIGTVSDIEDLNSCKSNGKCDKPCAKLCHDKGSVAFHLDDSKWYKVVSIEEIFSILKKSPKASYKLVGGNTARGVFKGEKPVDIYIDIKNVKELLTHSINNDSLILGANMSLTETMNLFYKLGAENPKFSYLTKLADHIDVIANVPVRNGGTLAGNLSMKHEYHGFQSDIFVILETANATVVTIGPSRAEVTMSLLEYLNYDMNRQIMKSIVLPALDDSFKYESYKIMPRAQNAHAIVNAGFLYKLKAGVVEQSTLVYGNINEKFNHATLTEKYLVGKKLFDNGTLQGAYDILAKELQTDDVPPDPSPAFRRQLAIALFYKSILSVAPPGTVTNKNQSGGQKLIRPLSNGMQDYPTNKSLYPLTKPMPKIEALAQTSGQAKYINDIPDLPGQLFMSFVEAKAPANSKIKSISADKVLKIPGVVAFYDKSDIPGKNTFTPTEIFLPRDEELFCDGVVKYYSQPIGIIVANTQALADKASELVDITYEKSTKKPLITIRDILKAGATDKIIDDQEIKPTRKGTDIKHVIKGKFDIGSQHHFYMETQNCLVVPTEDGYDMYPATQFILNNQAAASVVCKVPSNKFNISVRRLGGAYGGKITRSSICSTATALAAHKLKKPVRTYMNIEKNFKIIGKRFPFSADYEVGVDDNCVIQYLNLNIYTDYGACGGNENIMEEVFHLLLRKYNTDTWHTISKSTRSDTPTGTWCRSPGTTEGLALIETIMDHIAYELDKDPLEVRINNIDPKKEVEIINYINDVKQWADVDKRKSDIVQFNKENRWRKRGLSVVPMVYGFHVFGNWSVLISIYFQDGTVAITHGGVEMGQGINTKVAQVCAYSFGIPLEKVSVKPATNLTSPNAAPTGGSLTSEAVCLGVLKAVDILKERMKPIKDKMNNYNWDNLIKQCYAADVDLCATYMFSKSLPDVHPYTIYGVCVAEVEVDILTGNHLLTRVDLLEDVGDSMNPDVDVGQIEGAFIMGLGYWTCETIQYGDKGELLNKNTWTYKPPGAKDIPIDFRVRLPKNKPNPLGVLNSKAVAEPPLCLAVCIPLAIRDALVSARRDSNPNAEKWIPFDGPTSVETTFTGSLNDYKQYTL